MITINDLINQVDLLGSNDEKDEKNFIIRELQGIKETLKAAGECLQYGREQFIKENTLQNIDLYTKE